ncbi:MAG: YdbH domain-containing protein [Opitutaceae bacterium]|nr:YdbH domain-containing protein [Opitutaceae bacterium]
MRRPLRFLFNFALGAGLCGGAMAAGLPPLSGELTGKMEMRALRGAPPVLWRLQIQPPTDGVLQVQVTLTAPGFELHADAVLPMDGTPGQWKIKEGSIDLARWWRSAATAATLPDDLEVSGHLQLGGSGAVRDWMPEGVMTAVMQGGHAASSAQGWSADEINLSSTLALGAGGVALQTAQLKVGRAEAEGIVARNLGIEAAGAPDGRIAVSQTEVEVLGGRVVLAPFVFDPARLEVRTTAELTGVALSELASLLPETLAEAHGRLSGRIALHWSSAAGFEPGSGSLNVLPDTPASLRLAAAPGFLTQHMPERIQLVPAWLGPLARWLSPENPAYDSLRHIELGEQSLTVEKLRVELYPDGTGGARSATVEVSARPPAGSIVEQVSFTINVAGPLEQILKLGLDDRAKIKFGPLN